MLVTYKIHAEVYLITTKIYSDTEKNPGPEPGSYDKFSICH